MKTFAIGSLLAASAGACCLGGRRIRGREATTPRAFQRLRSFRLGKEREQPIQSIHPRRVVFAERFEEFLRCKTLASFDEEESHVWVGG